MPTARRSVDVAPPPPRSGRAPPARSSSPLHAHSFAYTHAPFGRASASEADGGSPVMVPHSSTPGSGAARPLSEATTAALTAAVRRAVGQPPLADAAAGPAVDHDRGLRDAVAAVVAEARERRLRPEELLTAFKAVLDAIPEAQAGVVGRVEETRLRERLVTLCIKAYYEA